MIHIGLMRLERCSSEIGVDVGERNCFLKTPGQYVGREPGRGMSRGVVGSHDLIKVLIPITHPLRKKDMK